MEQIRVSNPYQGKMETGTFAFGGRALQIESAINEVVWISETGEDGTFFYTKSIKKLTGYSVDEIGKLPEKHLSIMYKEDFSDVRRELNGFYKTENLKNITLIYRITTKDDIKKWIKEEISKKDNGVTVGVLTDYTETKKHEKSIRDYEQRLKDVNAAKDSFITILSHDLRAPFTSILGFSEILLNEPNLPIQDKTEYLTYIFEASQNQLQLINYLLDWSRLQTGKLIVEPERLRAQQVAFNCVSSLTGNAIRKNIDIIVDANEDIYINADERLITQALTNLLNNAIKFSPVNSKVEIVVNNFNNTQIEFVIRDYGIGITEEDQTKLFKVENMHTTEGTAGEKGSGLGLPLVKEIIEKHGGEIWFYSQQGNGSEFHFTVPKPLNTVLLVNNSAKETEELLEVIHKALPEYIVFTAENGYEAMSMLMEKCPSLVITEHDLPLMNGLQLIESIKKGNSVVKTPFVILAKNDTPELRQNYLNYGVSLIMAKPINLTEFKKILQNIII